MAMEYARLYFDFFTCEKTLYLTDMCGDEGIVCLLRLWIRAGQRNNDGIFEKTPRALEKIAGWHGDKGLLIETLLDTDFPLLDQLEANVYQLHNWEDNNPHLTEVSKRKRIDKARKAGKASAAKKQEETQLQVNNESTTSQLNSTQPQLDSTNVTKRNVTERNVIKNKGQEIELPGWLDKKSWSEWVLHRKEIKKKLTPSTIKKQLKFLEKHNGSHTEIINQSIMNGWAGLFKLKEPESGDVNRKKPAFLMTDKEQEEFDNECPF